MGEVTLLDLPNDIISLILQCSYSPIEVKLWRQVHPRFNDSYKTEIPCFSHVDYDDEFAIKTIWYTNSNGAKHGPYKVYNSSNKLLLSSFYIENLLEGELIEYYRGDITYKAKCENYSKGLLHGKSVVNGTHLGGNKVNLMTAHYRYGILDGHYRNYCPELETEQIGNYMNGNKIGRWQYYDHGYSI